MNIELVQRNFENYDNMHQSLNIKWRQSAKERKITRTQLTTNTAEELEPLSEVIVKSNDGNVANANANVIIRYMETPVEV